VLRFQSGILTSASPVISIVFVHGLQGHLYRTWAAPRSQATNFILSDRPIDDAGTSVKSRSKQDGIRNKALKVLGVTSATSSGHVTTASEEGSTRGKDDHTVSESRGDEMDDPGDISHEPPLYYWPREALPEFCPGARILTWGYDSHVTKGFKGGVNKSTVYQHGKDLLYGMGRLGSAPRPIIFVAHSLGGIVTKEMLSLSHNSSVDRIKAVVQSTAGVVFLGTPHRGSPWAQVGESASKIVSSLGLDASSALLDALGLKTSDLQRSQDAFSAIWNSYEFRVKTFQEGQGLKGTRFGGLNNKVVDDVSSSLGDDREQAEVLNANHRSICRFSGLRDPNLVKILAELFDVCSFSLSSLPRVPRVSISPKGEGHQDRIKPESVADIRRETDSVADTRHQESYLRAVLLLNSLSFPGMREASMPWKIHRECEWLVKHNAYIDWLRGRSAEPILWVKGVPGSGKTTAIRKALQMLSTDEQLSHTRVASFFFNSQATNGLLRSPLGLFRSLLCQLLPQDHRAMVDAVGLHRERLIEDQHEPIVWNLDQLLQMIQNLFVHGVSRTIIFIDALDECESDDNNIWLVSFFHDLIFKNGSGLRLCLTTRHLGPIPLQGCGYILAELENSSDIRRFIDKTFDKYQRQDEDKFKAIKEEIHELSRGIFLWTVLATEQLIKNVVKGKRNIVYLSMQLKKVPHTLMELYESLIAKAENWTTTLQVLKWGVLASRLTLREWRYLLPFLDRPVPHSLAQCRKSEYWARNDEDLADQICNISMGLVRVVEGLPSHTTSVINAATISTGGKSQDDQLSLDGRAGSLDSKQGRARYISVIHSSVVEFFKRTYVQVASPTIHNVGTFQLDIMHTCLDIIVVPELDELVFARTQEGHPEFSDQEGYSESSDQDSSMGRSRLRRGSSVRSFASASSTARRDQRPVALHSGSTIDGAHRVKTNITSPTGAQLDTQSETDLSRYLSSAEQAFSENEQRNFRLQLCSPPDWEDQHANRMGEEAIEEPALSVDSVDEGKIRVLQDYPEIIDYVLSEFSFHAHDAQHYGAPPNFVVWRLLLGDEKLWRRWLCLSEIEPYNTPLMDWARTEGLFTRTNCITGGTSR
ncbi:hypothetical protein PG993_011496, partial [Apiospora rasikravindrae]